jgi:hypothetical protein
MLLRLAFRAKAPLCALKAPRCTNRNTSYRMLAR